MIQSVKHTVVVAFTCRRLEIVKVKVALVVVFSPV